MILEQLKNEMMGNCKIIIRESTNNIDASILIDENLNENCIRIIEDLESLEKKQFNEVSQLRIDYENDFIALKTISKAESIVTKIELLEEVRNPEIRQEFIKNLNQITSEEDFESLCQAIPSQKVVEVLAANGFDFNLTNDRGETILSKSIIDADKEYAFNSLMEFDGNILTKEQLSEGLRVAINEDALEKAEKLINKGADVNTIYEDDYTPLMEAASYGSPEMVSLLCEKGAEVNYINNEGYTALAIASEYPVRNDFNIDEDEDFYEYIRLKETLEEHGANKYATNEKGYTSLMIAVENENIKLVHSNLDLNVDPKYILFDHEITVEKLAKSSKNEEIKNLILKDNKVIASTSQASSSKSQSKQGTVQDNKEEPKQKEKSAWQRWKERKTPEELEVFREKRRISNRKYLESLTPEKKEQINQRRREHRLSKRKLDFSPAEKVKTVTSEFKKAKITQEHGSLLDPKPSTSKADWTKEPEKNNEEKNNKYKLEEERQQKIIEDLQKQLEEAKAKKEVLAQKVKMDDEKAEQRRKEEEQRKKDEEQKRKEEEQRKIEEQKTKEAEERRKEEQLALQDKRRKEEDYQQTM